MNYHLRPRAMPFYRVLFGSLVVTTMGVNACSTASNSPRGSDACAPLDACSGDSGIVGNDNATASDATVVDAAADTGDAKAAFDYDGSVLSPLTVGNAIGIAGSMPLGSDPGSVTVRQTNMAVELDAGVHLSRIDLTWSGIEPSEGNFDYTMIDTGVEALVNAGITPLPILDYGNPWADNFPLNLLNDDKIPPWNLGAYSTFVGNVATRLRGKVPAYEIWNEENSLRFWQGTPGNYATLIETAASAIRGADPNAKVLFGGLFYHGGLEIGGAGFLDEVYKADANVNAAFDGVCVHPYPSYPPSVPPEYSSATEVPQQQMIQNVRNVMNAHGDANKPIYVTEVGWDTSTPVTQDQQARWTVRSILLLLASGVQNVVLYTLEDGNNPNQFPPTENYFGLLNYAPPGSTPIPKPAWTAIVNLLKLCGASHVTADLRASLSTLPADGYAYRLDGPSSRVTVLWRSDESQPTTNVIVPVTGSAVSLVALDGTTKVQQPSGGVLAVPVGTAPVYVVESP